MGAYCSLRRGTNRRDLLQTQSFEQEQRDFTFGFRQIPPGELRFDRLTEAVERGPGLLTPPLSLKLRNLQIAEQIDTLLTRSGCFVRGWSSRQTWGGAAGGLLVPPPAQLPFHVPQARFVDPGDQEEREW